MATVFARFRALPSADRPRPDQAKADGPDSQYTRRNPVGRALTPRTAS
jgi:hypothetical protein